MWVDGELVGVLDLLLPYPDQETVYLGLWFADWRRLSLAL